MTSQGTAHGRFQRAIRDRHLRRATMAARELGNVSLADALALTLLTREVGDDRWPRAAARWLGRFIVESPAMTIGEAGLAAAAVQELAGRDSRLAAETLRQLAATHGHATVAALLGAGEPAVFAASIRAARLYHHDHGELGGRRLLLDEAAQSVLAFPQEGLSVAEEQRLEVEVEEVRGGSAKLIWIVERLFGIRGERAARHTDHEVADDQRSLAGHEEGELTGRLPGHADQFDLPGDRLTSVKRFVGLDLRLFGIRPVNADGRPVTAAELGGRSAVISVRDVDADVRRKVVQTRPLLLRRIHGINQNGAVGRLDREAVERGASLVREEAPGVNTRDDLPHSLHYLTNARGRKGGQTACAGKTHGVTFVGVGAA
jgi:hypothetical protein